VVTTPGWTAAKWRARKSADSGIGFGWTLEFSIDEGETWTAVPALVNFSPQFCLGEVERLEILVNAVHGIQIVREGE
jgi:hypothetical protein